MKKVLFLMFLLFLMGLGTANVKAQVRIGGNTAPSAAAVLDLNASDLTNAGMGGLALPRVSLNGLSGTTANLNGATPLTGMLVYNTNATLGVGIYFWNGSNWVIISGDGVIGNELTDTITGGGLMKTGTGTAANPYKVGLQTTPAGYVLRSTGNSWMSVPLTVFSATAPVNLNPWNHGVATLTQALDTVVSVTVPALTTVNISAPNIGWFTTCVVNDAGQFFTFCSYGNSIAVYNSSTIDRGFNHLRCYNYSR